MPGTSMCWGAGMNPPRRLSWSIAVNSCSNAAVARPAVSCMAVVTPPKRTWFQGYSSNVATSASRGTTVSVRPRASTKRRKTRPLMAMNPVMGLQLVAEALWLGISAGSKHALICAAACPAFGSSASTHPARPRRRISCSNLSARPRRTELVSSYSVSRW